MAEVTKDGLLLLHCASLLSLQFINKQTKQEASPMDSIQSSALILCSSGLREEQLRGLKSDFRVSSTLLNVFVQYIYLELS